ncbi:amino acid tansporter [Trypanosoma cruzi Dm28c]|uniref:Amino acid tansporter n=2 Tax=Trypanosoma cruzi TaxID=5693 RepID=V5BJY7_TRYCR|nr:amino acid tansporter [Trypanosoma cruzi Dm28c]PBJ75697.1 amino acid tansporter [Trypanosoma cruzi cruzi]PWU90728.1 putative amino acid permease 24 [Trypanosoma cruzi]
MTSREEKSLSSDDGAEVVAEKTPTEPKDVQQRINVESPMRFQRESTRASVHEPHLPVSCASGLSTSSRWRSAASLRSDGKQTPSLSECSRTLTPVPATHRLDAVNVAVLDSNPRTAMLQRCGHHAAANYHTSLEFISNVVETKKVDPTYESDEDIDIHSLGERLTDVLESSLRGAASVSQRGKANNTLGRAAFHIFKGNVGAGVFLLSTYYKDAGYGVGFLLVFLLGVLMIDCALALVRSKQKIDLLIVRTYPAVVGHILGSTLMHFTNFSLIFTQFGFCVVYIQYASSMFTALLSATQFYQLLVLLSVLMVMPMSLFSHNMRMLAYASMIAALFVALVLAGAVAEELDYLSTRGVSQGTVFFEPTMRILVFISGHMFSLEGIGVVLPVENSMAAEDRPQFSTLVKYTLASIVTIYVLFGLLGYLAFGEALQTSVVLAIPPSTTRTMLQVLLGLSLIFSYPIQFLPAIQLVDRALGISVHKDPWNAYIVRAVLNIFFGAIAASIGADTINVFASFLGAFTGVHLMITMPVLLALFTDRVLNCAQEDAEISFCDYVKLFFTMPDTIVECRWYLYLFIAMLVWIGGTYYTFDSVFG